MKKLVIIGTGLHHVQLLQSLTQQALEGVQVTLVAPTLRQLYGPMLTDFVSGQVSLEESLIDLEPLLKNSGIRWLPYSVSALDASTQTLTLSNASSLAFDWLSLNTANTPDLAQLELKLPGTQAHGLLLHPSDTFAQLWPDVLAQAASRTLRIAVLGDSLHGVEIALAVRHRLPGASITLVMSSAALAQGGSANLPARLVLALKQGHITVLDDHAVYLTEGEVMLGCGAGLICDLPIIALRPPAPGWLAASTLALDEQGFPVTDAHQRSTSHPLVFSADQAVDTAQQTLWRRLSTQVGTELAFANALIASLKGLPRRATKVPGKSWSLMSSGGTSALACWGQYCLQAGALLNLKHRINRSAVQRMRKP